ncbi:hypothetical protein IQ07DRAFT_40642 [Pyrenochaeta sp. DS3sAY3a]|nr:hypothetical protein IQ07DRAFT_40642 [Pyrenochaeta sp. DS3sAY3a]
MPSFLSNVAAHAKAHHEAVNAAYTTYYGIPASTPSSTEPSRANSVATPTSAAEKRPTNAAKAWNAIKKHHHEMNEAYTVFYAPSASSRQNSAASSPRHSVDEPREQRDEAPRNYQKMWKGLKGRIVEHHRSVNAASSAVYGF